MKTISIVLASLLALGACQSTVAPSSQSLNTPPPTASTPSPEREKIVEELNNFLNWSIQISTKHEELERQLAKKISKIKNKKQRNLTLHQARLHNVEKSLASLQALPMSYPESQALKNQATVLFEQMRKMQQIMIHLNQLPPQKSLERENTIQQLQKTEQAGEKAQEDLQEIIQQLETKYHFGKD